MPSFDFENRFRVVAGIDEAGCGPWAGPVVAGACVFLNQKQDQSFLNHINDSKKLTRKKRNLVFGYLTTLCSLDFLYGIGSASVEEIDTMTIGQATFLAMKRAVENLPLSVETLLVDGVRKPPFNQETICVIKGDQLSYSIAAASILAKVTRDRFMAELHKDFPYYGWEKNVGYGTREHQSALKKFGVSPHHRRSFSPVAACI